MVLDEEMDLWRMLLFHKKKNSNNKYNLLYLYIIYIYIIIYIYPLSKILFIPFYVLVFFMFYLLSQ